MNTSQKNKEGVHWWSILKIDPKKELLLFGSYGFIGFKFLSYQTIKLSLVKYCITSIISIKKITKLTL